MKNLIHLLDVCDTLTISKESDGIIIRINRDTRSLHEFISEEVLSQISTDDDVIFEYITRKLLSQL